MIKIVVVAPGYFAPSGGPEALHQLVYMCNEVESGSAAIYYESDNVVESCIQPYQKYNCPRIKKQDIPPSALVILPEIWPELSSSFVNNCALWWLSVDFFGSHGHSNLDGIDLHLTQSRYAYDYVVNQLKKPAMMLSDWIDLDCNDVLDKSNSVCVNPSKGLSLIESFESQNKDLRVIKLQSMTKDQLITTLSTSKIYIDFGHHPGKDRIPREASLCGCVVFVKKEGAGCYFEDVYIDDYYKFDDINELDDKVKDVMNNFSVHKSNQRTYQDKIKKEKDTFRIEVKKLLEVSECTI